MKPTWPVLLLLLFLSTPAAVQAQFTYQYKGGIYGFDTNADGSITINGYSGSPDAIVPNSISNQPVTTIGSMASTNLIAASIPDNVTTIGSNAFAGSTNLIDVEIGDYVTSIEDGAFSDCSSLVGVTIPENVITIGQEAFDGCTSLTYVEISDSVTTIGDSAFSSCTSLLNITIPDSVTSIGSDAFGGCASLTNVTIGNGLTSIGDYMFSQLPKLASVTIGANVTSIGQSAFYYCTSLAKITIPNLVATIGSNAFSGCTSLTRATIGSSVTSIEDSAFAGCTNMTGVEIGDSVITIGDSAFAGCQSLTNLTIPDSVTSIGDSAFFYCINLTNATIGNSVTSIGYNAFADSFSLGSVTIGGSVTSIGGVAFANTSLTNVTIPDSVTSIGDGAFGVCTNLASVTIPVSVTSIAEGAFGSCTSLRNATIPSGAIGDLAFAQCFILTNVTLGSGVTSIGSFTFQQCALTSLTIPDSVTSLGSNAFASCSSMTNAIIGNGVTSIGDDAFWECTSLADVTLGNSVASIGDLAFQQCNLASIAIPASVTSIGDAAFVYCASLASVCFEGNASTNFSGDAFVHDPVAVIYYLVGAKGWGTTAFDGIRTASCAQCEGGAFLGGALQVAITPAKAITAGARWQMDGNGQWETNAAVVGNLTPGNYTLSFKPIAGWGTAAAQTVAIKRGVTTKAAGVYIPGDPKLTISAPLSGQSVSNSPLLVHGATTDKESVTNVYIQLNGGSWILATPSNSWSNWTASVTLIKPGPNSISACAVDNGGAFSTTNTIAFKYIPSARLTVQTNGLGGITPVDNGKLLAIGSNYTLDALPAKNWILSNWVGGTATPYAVLGSNLSYTFPMQSNLVLQANFVPNPFLAVQGDYNGLYYASSPVTEQSSGFASITIAPTSKGAYSAAFKVDGGSYPFSGMFDLNGNSVANIKRTGKSPLSLNLHIDLNLTPPADSITGSVEASNWSGPSSLQADKAWFNGTTIKASNYAGKYTFVLPGSPGYSVAEISNNPAGNAILTGSLADNTTITSLSTPISKEGYVPIYYSYSPGTNVIFGWLNLTNDPAQAVQGNLTWFKLPATKGLYSGGFTSQTNITGSLYAPMTTNTLITGGTLTIADPVQGISLIYSNVSIIANKLTCATPPANQLTATITPATGAISLSFRPTGAKANLTAQGVMLQNSPTDSSLKAAGWFLGTNQTGYFMLTH